MNRILIVFPLKKEIKLFKRYLAKNGLTISSVQTRGFIIEEVQSKHLFMAAGGVGYEKYYEQCKKLCELIDPQLLICMGTAGSLDDQLSVGDIILANHSIEVKSESEPKSIRQYTGDSSTLKILSSVVLDGCVIFESPIITVNHSVLDRGQAKKLLALTSASAVACEGTAGAQVAADLKLAFLEVRAITDFANELSEVEFHQNLELAVKNLANLTVEWQKR